jgi:hypothetical protein
MNNKSVVPFVRIVLFLLYVWAVREAYTFMYADSCLDAGGALESSGLCSGPTLAEAPDLGARAPFIFWLVVLAVPAAAVWLLDRVVGAVIQRQLPNKTMEPTR